MTETEFVKLICKVEYGDPTHKSYYYITIVEAAKIAGAKFDPECQIEQYDNNQHREEES